MNRINWRRILPGDNDFTSNDVMRLLDSHFDSGQMHSINWFPGPEYRVIGNRNYLVDPSISNPFLVPWDGDDAPILSRACFLAHPWRVTEEIWRMFQWDNRIVYVPHFRAGEKNNIYRRAIVPFSKTPKPSWADFKNWEIDFEIAAVVRNHPSTLMDRVLMDSQRVLLDSGQSLEFLEAAKATLRDRIVALKAPILTTRGGLGVGSTAEEIRDAKVLSFNALYAALDPAAVDAAMLAEIEGTS